MNRAGQFNLNLKKFYLALGWGLESGPRHALCGRMLRNLIKFRAILIRLASLKNKPYWSRHRRGFLRARRIAISLYTIDLSGSSIYELRVRPVAFLSQYRDTVRVDRSCYSPRNYSSLAVQDRNIAVPVRGVQVPKHSHRSHAAITLIDPHSAITTLTPFASYCTSQQDLGTAQRHGDGGCGW